MPQDSENGSSSHPLMAARVVSSESGQRCRAGEAVPEAVEIKGRAALADALDSDEMGDWRTMAPGGGVPPRLYEERWAHQQAADLVIAARCTRLPSASLAKRHGEGNDVDGATT